MSASLLTMSRIVSVQYLRAAAALMVVFFHAEGMAAEYFNVGWPSFGAAGVDIFFVISGFIMWITTAPERATPSSFVVNRVVRIVPLYWLATLLLYGGWICVEMFLGWREGRRWSSALLMPLLYLGRHVSYALGTIWGLLAHPFRRLHSSAVRVKRVRL